MNEMDENKMINTVLFTSTSASLYEMLAEEASELSTAASKYARYLRDDQPLGEEWTPAAGFAKKPILCNCMVFSDHQRLGCY